MAELEEDNRELRELAESQANHPEKKAIFALTSENENAIRSQDPGLAGLVATLAAKW